MIGRWRLRCLNRLGSLKRRLLRAATRTVQDVWGMRTSLPLLAGMTVGGVLLGIALRNTREGGTDAASWWQASGTILGLVFIWWEINEVRRNAEVQERATRSELYRGASDGMARINEVFFRYPWLRSYFYDGRPASQLPVPSEVRWGERANQIPDKETLRVLTESVAEMYADFADDLLEQYGTIPDEMDWATWWAYLRFIYNNSPAFREFMDDNIDFYPDYLHAVFGHLIVRDPDTRRLLGRWAAFPVSQDVESKDESRRLRAARKRLAVFDRLATSDPHTRRYPWYGRWYLELREWRSTGACRPDTDRIVRGRPPNPAIAASVLPLTASSVNVLIAWPLEVGCDGACPSSEVTPAACDLARHREVVTSWLLKLLDRSGARTVRVYESFSGQTTLRPVRTYDLRRLKLYSRKVTYHPSTYGPEEFSTPWSPPAGFSPPKGRNVATSLPSPR